MKPTAATTESVDRPAAAPTPVPGEPKPGARPGSDPEAKNGVPGTVRDGDGAVLHRPGSPSEIDRSTDA